MAADTASRLVPPPRGRRLESAFETGKQDFDVVAPRLRELREQHAQVSEVLAQLKPLDAPPKHLRDDATIARFQAVIRDIFISARHADDEALLEHADHIEIKAKPLNALAFLAAAPSMQPRDVNHPEAVLTKGGTGSGRGTRTPGQSVNSRSLYQLSYSGMGCAEYPARFSCQGSVAPAWRLPSAPNLQ